MPSGGHARSGPAPDPSAIRRERKSDQAGWITLEPRTGALPEWPLTESSKREDAMWARLWSSPQAVMWERNGHQDEVAVYVRTFCEATVTNGSAALRALLRQQMESLGLSGSGLARLRWRISSESSQQETVPTDDSGKPTRPGSRARLRILQKEARTG